MEELHRFGRDVDDAEKNGKLESSRPNGARIEHSELVVTRNERHMRMTADDERCIFSAREAFCIGAEAWTVHRNVEKEDAEDHFVAAKDIERQHVGKVRGATIDVASNRKQGSNGLECCEHGQMADVPGVENGVRHKSCHMGPRLGMRCGMRIGDHREPQASVGARRNLRVTLLYVLTSHDRPTLHVVPPPVFERLRVGWPFFERQRQTAIAL